MPEMHKLRYVKSHKYFQPLKGNSAQVFFRLKRATLLTSNIYLAILRRQPDKKELASRGNAYNNSGNPSSVVHYIWFGIPNTSDIRKYCSLYSSTLGNGIERFTSIKI